MTATVSAMTSRGLLRALQLPAKMLHRPPALDGGGQRAFVQVVERAAHRHALGNPADNQAVALQLLGEVMRGRLALDRGVEREQHLSHGRYSPLDQLADVELLRSDPIQRR